MVAALRFFSTITLGRPDQSCKLIRIHCRRKLPTVLSIEEVGRLLSVTRCINHRAALSGAYGAGLRVEVARSRVGDIDSKRTLIRVERGKSLPLRRPGRALSTSHAVTRSAVAAAGTVAGSSEARRDAACRMAVSGCSRFMPPASSPSSVSHMASAAGVRLSAISRRFRARSGWSKPSRPLPVPKRCLPIWPAILTGLPSRTAG
jgi:integrase